MTSCTWQRSRALLCLYLISPFSRAACQDWSPTKIDEGDTFSSNAFGTLLLYIFICVECRLRHAENRCFSAFFFFFFFSFFSHLSFILVSLFYARWTLSFIVLLVLIRSFLYYCWSADHVLLYIRCIFHGSHHSLGSILFSSWFQHQCSETSWQAWVSPNIPNLRTSIFWLW